MTLSRRSFLCSMTAVGGMTSSGSSSAVKTRQPRVRIGIIGLSVHSADFTEIINSDAEFNNFRVTALYHPPGNPDVEFSTDQLRKFTEVADKHQVKLAGSMNELLAGVDAVMLLTNDGRPHLEQILPVLKANKPVYIDKPIAENLENVMAIYDASRHYKTPVFSSSALRYMASAQKLAGGNVVGKVIGADTHGPAPIQTSHVDLFWDGIHGIELLFTVMGSGCTTVSRLHTAYTDLVTGVWDQERIGTFRGLRSGGIGFGGTVYGATGTSDIGKFDGYKGLVSAIVKFFDSKIPPVSPAETLEIYAFMEAAQRSKALEGAPVKISEVLAGASRK